MPPDNFLPQVLAGLRARPRTLPSQFFYDQRGSELFDQICELPEYYPTRTEMAILRRHADEMARLIDPSLTLHPPSTISHQASAIPHTALLELGSGSSLKTRILLDAAPSLAAYIPIDISRDHLLASADRLARAYPHLEVLPLWADYSQPFTLPRPAADIRRTVIYFPGSTLGNFHENEAVAFLHRLTRLQPAPQGLLIGIDLRKSPDILIPAYDDAQGVTAAFNLNLLARINRELGADFDLGRFAHRALWNDAMSRMEMHLVSLAPQRAHVADQAFDFSPGETIRTECSYKYTFDGFAALARSAGWTPAQTWTDADTLFSVHYLTRA